MQTLQAQIIDGTLYMPEIPSGAIAVRSNGTTVTVYEQGDDVPEIDYGGVE